jgi:GNAT superfamily N-acetyltransferase
LHTLTEYLRGPFFDSVRAGYEGFDDWFRRKAQEGRRAWIYRAEDSGYLSAICIYAVQHDERVTDKGKILEGPALKLCTFKVGEAVRGRKIGELFLRAAFRYATDQHCEAIFLHANAQRHAHLTQLLEDFGFSNVGSYQGDQMYVKQHPVQPPAIDMTPFQYLKRFYPHYMSGIEVRKFIIPIQPRYHDILFPDYDNPGRALPANHPRSHVSNAIKLAYLSHMPNKRLRMGDLVLFYRTRDLKALTTLGVVEQFEISTSSSKIAQLVNRRTVYSDQEIVEMAERETKVVLFRLIRHLPNPIFYETLCKQRVIQGPIQSTVKITDESFSRIL